MFLDSSSICSPAGQLTPLDPPVRMTQNAAERVGFMDESEKKIKSQWPWVITAQINSLALLGLWWIYESPFQLSEKQVLSLGQTFSMILIALGVWGYIASRKTPLPPAVFIAMGLVAPGYALCGGHIKTIISYFLVTLGLHLIFLWRQHIYLLEKTKPPMSKP